MTSEFDTELIATAGEFVNTFGEDIVYRKLGGGSRSIKAVITRRPPEVIDGAPHGTAPKIEIYVVNSAVTGISSSEVDRGGDMVTIQRLIGETAGDRAIAKILSHDAGMMKLEVN